jgi:hypothetical protein
LKATHHFAKVDAKFKAQLSANLTVLSLTSKLHGSSFTPSITDIDLHWFTAAFDVEIEEGVVQRRTGNRTKLTTIGDPTTARFG